MSILMKPAGSNSTIILGVLVCLLIFGWISRSNRIAKGLRLPPGPRGRLISGNAADMPTHHEWITFTQWAKEYGELVYTNVFGQPMVIVNSANVARDLFDKRSKIYSDRFDFPMLNDLMGFDWDFGLMRYGEWWRRHRRVFHQEFHSSRAVKYHDIQTRQTRALLRRFLETPAEFVGHIRHLSGAIIIEVTYGLDVLPGDRYIETAQKTAEAMVKAGVPGAFLVDTIPILKFVPEWMIGAGFQKTARETRALNAELVETLFTTIKKSFNAGTAKPSVLTSLLESLSTKINPPLDEEVVIRNAAAVAYLAGSDTTVSALTTFMLAMLTNPHAQRKAQAELDLVVGTSRLPGFEDRENLPYVNALCQEVLRWHPVVPLGVAHRLMQDDVYGDYFIPRGSIVIGNSWAMLQDEKLYGPEPDKFRPERFLDPTVMYPIFTFGFGRRICPGRHLADSSIFIGVASILKVFYISPAKDANGIEISVEPSFTSGFLSYPEPFQCSINLRSASALDLLLDKRD